MRHALTLVRVFGAAAGGGGLDLAALTTLFDDGAAHGAESLAERAQSALLARRGRDAGRASSTGSTASAARARSSSTSSARCAST